MEDLKSLFEATKLIVDAVDWSAVILFFKIVFLSISFILFVVIILLLIRLKKYIAQSLNIFSKSIGVGDLPKKQMVKKWEVISKKIDTTDDNAYKLAVIEADKFFDDILKKIGYKGKDMGERMKQITPAQMSNIGDLWRAHKTRNSMVHDPDFKLNRSQAEEVVRIYEKALKELQVI